MVNNRMVYDIKPFCTTVQSTSIVNSVIRRGTAPTAEVISAASSAVRNGTAPHQKYVLYFDSDKNWQTVVRIVEYMYIVVWGQQTGRNSLRAVSFDFQN